MTGKRSLLVNQRGAAGIPAYLADLKLVRGSCLERKRGKRCRSRYGIVRLSIDFRSARSRDTLATVECARCGHVWYRTRPPALGEYQSVRLTLILPAYLNRWFARGRWHAEGSDGLVLTDATWADLIEAQTDWRKRADQLTAAAAKKAAKKAATEAEAIAATRTLLASWAEREAEAAAEEAAAQERSNA